MQIRFWGTRGSIPVSGPEYVEFGGNTPCLEIRLRRSTELLILDSGTGIRALGQALMADPTAPRRLHLVLTHAHWDHIQGFPFFAPAYVPGFEIDIYCTKDAHRFLEGQMSPPYFPVDLTVMGAKLQFHQLEARGERTIAGARIRWIPLPHPQGSTGIRVEEDGRSFVFATDTEHPEAGLNQDLVTLARDAEALVYDAQYTPAEYAAGKRGWGHSTWHDGAMLARASGVKKLVLFSHDPLHDDDECRRIETETRRIFPEVWSARQNGVLDL